MTLAEQVAALPQGPGVYVLFGRERLPIYVGKSVNLRRRVRQHLSRPPSSERHFREMAAGVREVGFHSTETELHALLLEDELIKRHRPAYNRRQKKFLLQRYLALRPDRAAAPSVVAEAADAPGAEVFGPFSDEHYAARLAAVAARYFGLGPRIPSVEQPPTDLRAALAFLGGESDEVLTRIRGEVGRHREALEFELAAAARDRLRLCEGFLRRQRFFLDFKRGALLVEDRAPKTRGYFLFVRGRLRGHWRCRPRRAELLRLGAGSSDEPPKPGAVHRRAGSAEPAEPVAFLFDRAALLRAWLSTEPATRSCAVLPDIASSVRS